MKRSVILLVSGMLLVSACSSASPTTTTEETTTTTVEETTTTTAPEVTSTTAEATDDSEGIPTEPVVAGENADADAIVDVYAVVFDSTTTFEEKAPFIDDPSGLESTVEAYMNAGEAVGGIILAVTEVGIDGDQAATLYDLLFAENPFQTNVTGEAVRNNGEWQVTREYFCSIMTLARVGCP